MKRKIRRRDRIWTRQKEYRLTNSKISEKKDFKSKKWKLIMPSHEKKVFKKLHKYKKNMNYVSWNGKYSVAR